MKLHDPAPEPVPPHIRRENQMLAALTFVILTLCIFLAWSLWP
jgi:hypothetical protein